MELNIQFQKVIDGLTVCNQSGYVDSECTRCPYNEDSFVKSDSVDEGILVVDFSDNACFNKLNSDALDLLKEYDSALRAMVYQYCTIDKYFLNGKDCDNPEQEVFFNRFMSAGEETFRILGIENGEEVTDEFIWG